MNLFSFWDGLTAKDVKNGITKEGVRLIVILMVEYRILFDSTICKNCPSFANNYDKFKNKLKYMEKQKVESEYVLKPMYNGIQLKFGSSIVVNNETMTDENGKYLLETHIKGKDLFESLPKDDDLEKDFDKSSNSSEFPNSIDSQYVEIKALSNAFSSSTKLSEISGTASNSSKIVDSSKVEEKKSKNKKRKTTKK